MSFTILFLISLERCLNVVHNNYYKHVITNRSLIVTITLVTLLSIVRSTIDTLLAINLEKRKLLKLFIALTVYLGIFTIIAVVLNVAFLRNVKQ